MAHEKRRVAVFDVDGTIFRSSLLLQLIDELIENGSFKEETRAAYEKQRVMWLDREGDYGAYIEAAVTAFKKNLKGVHYGELVEASEQMVAKNSKRLYRYARDLIHELKDKGYYLLALSHSPKTVLDKFCPQLGFDKAYGTIYEIGPQDLFTGKMVDEHIIYNKAATLKRAIEKENLTLQHSIGVGDTESDIGFLELVAKPICFNPNMKLYKYAKRMGWKTVVERKDVIYDM